jgi:hypothetical protein
MLHVYNPAPLTCLIVYLMSQAVICRPNHPKPVILGFCGDFS